MATRTTQQDKIKCGLCAAEITQDQYRAHVGGCGVVKRCALCGKQVDNLAEHYTKCTGGDHAENNGYNNQPKSVAPQKGQHIPSNITNRKTTKKCVICSTMVDEDVYTDHVDACSVRPSTTSPRTRDTKACIICSKEIDAADYVNHVNGCLNATAVQQNNTNGSAHYSKPMPAPEYVNHVNEYPSRSSTTSKPSKPTIKLNDNSCFTCSSIVSYSKNSSHTIPCRSRHMYCLKCLQRSMNEYIQSNSPPVCHSAFCDYELSRYDIACLPLEANIIQRLLPSVTNTQRAQCPLCLFYVEFNTMNDLERHATSCDSGNLIPCEYCHCLYDMHRLDAHSRQCRNDPRAQQQKALIDFVLPRTKYPVTEPQLRVFIEHRKKNRLPLDPRSMIDALAIFGAVFPLDVPTRDCDVCSATCTYDDIFVFGCDENHKLCYGCFEDSCKVKMNSKEILKCAMCAYQLQEGEIKQLRVPSDRKREFLDYQMQKTFSTYSDGTQGVIKCPNQGCKWIAEAQNVNDRFQVTCRLCNHQFCSLCSQQYHFRSTCQQMPEITQRWFFWCNTERGNYWQARAQQDATFRAQLEDYQQQRAANEQRNAELQQRYNELLGDEAYKVQNCRLCPHCRRAVQHLGGCSSMICGKNYHGGDQQSGCGKGFDWSQALPYVPIANTGPQQVQNNLPAPAEQKTIVHPYVQCDSCQNQVQGIRFDCCHCASLTFCEKCEQRATLEHSNQIRDEQKQQHVFRLIPRPLDENNGQ